MKRIFPPFRLRSWLRAAAALGLLVMLLPAALRAEDPPAGATETEAPVATPAAATPALELNMTFSIVSPSRLVLTNSAFEVPYGDPFAGLPAIQFGIGRTLVTLGDFQIGVVGRGGYGYRSGPVTMRAADGSLATGPVSLHWVPLSFALRTHYHIPGIDFVRPSLSVGGGAHYLLQEGAPAGLTQGFWVPRVFLTPALSFLGGDPVRDWFNGFTFGVMLDQSVATPQVVRGWSFDLSFSIFL